MRRVASNYRVTRYTGYTNIYNELRAGLMPGPLTSSPTEADGGVHSVINQGQQRQVSHVFPAKLVVLNSYDYLRCNFTRARIHATGSTKCMTRTKSPHMYAFGE